MVNVEELPWWCPDNISNLHLDIWPMVSFGDVLGGVQNI